MKYLRRQSSPSVPSLPPPLRHRDFRRLWLGLLGSGLGTQMVSVAVGWQVYAIHQSAFDLGLIGLAEFLPLLLLALPAGQLADRLPRPTLAALSGAAAAIGSPAARALTPEIVPVSLLTGAIALRSIAGQAATVAGPAVGGLLFAISPEAVYA